MCLQLSALRALSASVLLTSGGHARLTAKNGAWVHFFLFGASVLRCACISSVKLFQFFWKLFQFFVFNFDTYGRITTVAHLPIGNLNFVWPVLAWLLACVFLMNLSAFLLLRAFVQSICRNDFQERTFHVDATT